MGGSRLRRFLLFLLLAAVGYWFYSGRPSFSKLVDAVTGPLFESNAAVDESEHKRVMAQPAAQEGEDASLAVVRKNMGFSDVRRLLGNPDATEEFREDGRRRVRWVYREGRTIGFEDGRVVSIAVR
ncbi:MAG TPA: hypothetical protein VLO07_08780 [Thermoanaerobaculia bacterium]|nr:hypothetical protein [Thermoanaerobaculia bacterium]